MNIIIINDFATINGGAAKVAIDGAIGLAELGYPVLFFSAVGPISPILIEAGVEVICLDQYDVLNDTNRPRAIINGVWNFSAANRMRKVLQRYSPEDTIIHVHGWTKALSSSPIRAAIQKGYKVILTMHDYFIACPNGGFFDYPAKTICTKKPLSYACITRNCDVRSFPQKTWRVIRQIVQKYIGQVPSGITRFVAISSSSLNILTPYLPVCHPVQVISNPIDVPKQKPVKVAENQKIVYIGRLSKEKGCELFTKAIRQNNFQGVMVGDGPLLETLKTNNPNIQFTGWLSPANVREILQTARALVFPSLLYEVQPLIVFEAISLGIPVIVANTTFARDFVIDEITGLWFQSDCLSDLLKKIDLLKDDDFVKKLGIAAYNNYWQKPLLPDKYIRNLINMFNEILEL